MNKKLLYILFALLVTGSIALAYSKEGQLEGAFTLKGSSKSTANLSSILHISSSATNTSDISWDETETNTLGVWRIKADQNITLNGLSFHIGAPSALGVSDDYLPNFFQSCTLEVKEGSTVVQTVEDTCYLAYTNITMTAGKTYSLNFKGSPLNDSYEDFIDKEYDNKQVALSIIALTKSDGSQIKYNEDGFNTLVDQEGSSSITESGKTLNLEYTYGGYSLNNILLVASSAEHQLTVKDSEVEIAPQETYTKSSSVSPTISSAIQSVINRSLTLSIPDITTLSKDLTITVDADNKTVKVNDGSSTKTCTSTSSGTYNCQIPQ